MSIARRTLTAWAAAVVVAATLVGLAPTATAAAPRYVATFGNAYGAALGINHRGDLLVSTFSGEPQGSLVLPGREPITLLAADGSHYVQPAAINNAGVSVGTARGTNLITRPTQWSRTGVPTVLARPAGVEDGRLEAADINNRGVVVGSDSGAIVEWTTPTTPRVVVRKGEAGSGTALAYAINDRGVIAARIDNHAALISVDGRVRPLGRLAGETYSEADDVNNSGVAIGVASTSAGTFPVQWDADGTVHRIGGASTRPLAIADDGTIVGYVRASAGSSDRAYIRSAAGVVTFLRPLPDGLGAFAFAINDLGVVAGQTVFQGYAKTTVWTPSS